MAGDSTPLFKALGGAGADCILIHGFASDSLSWAANIPVLLPLARLHAVDLPAHGACASLRFEDLLATDAGHFLDGMQEAGISSAHFIGHSLGGAMALAVAASRPEAVKSLTLIAPLGLGHGVDEAHLEALVNVRSVDEATVQLQRLFVNPRLVNRLLAKRLLDYLERPGIRQALARVTGQIAAWERADLPQLIAEIPAHIPRRVFWGANDAVNRADRERIQGFGAELIEVEKAGHLPHIEQAGVVNTAIASLLAGGADS